MKTNKEKYMAPRAEVILLQLEECIAASFGNGASDNATPPTFGKSNTYWNSSGSLLNSED